MRMGENVGRASGAVNETHVDGGGVRLSGGGGGGFADGWERAQKTSVPHLPPVLSLTHPRTESLLLIKRPITGHLPLLRPQGVKRIHGLTFRLGRTLWGTRAAASPTH